jgi:hypothetical protein
MWRSQLEAQANGQPLKEFGTPDPKALQKEEFDAMGFNA